MSVVDHSMSVVDPSKGSNYLVFSPPGIRPYDSKHEFSSKAYLSNHYMSKIYEGDSFIERVSRRIALFFGYAKKIQVFYKANKYSKLCWGDFVVRKKSIAEAYFNKFFKNKSNFTYYSQAKTKCKRLEEYIFKAIKKEKGEDREKELIRQLAKDPLFQKCIWDQLRNSRSDGTYYYDILASKKPKLKEAINVACQNGTEYAKIWAVLENHISTTDGSFQDFQNLVSKNPELCDAIAETLCGQFDVYTIIRSYKI